MAYLKRGRWTFTATVDGKTSHIGFYKTRQEAERAEDEFKSAQGIMRRSEGYYDRQIIELIGKENFDLLKKNKFKIRRRK
jgi:hypothetical protein